MGTLWYGGTIYTMVEEGEKVEAVLVEDGVIQAAGKEEVLRDEWKHKITEEIQLHNQVMYPGFVDSHLHLIGHGEKLLRLDLTNAKSGEEVLALLKQKASEVEKGEWIIGEGWDENQWDHPYILHRQQLDEVAPNHPLIIKRVCRHALIANSKALEISGLSKEIKDPIGGVIHRDEDGTPNGFLLDQAQELVTAYIPLATEAYLQKALTVAIDDCLQYGLTGGHSEDLNYYGGFLRTYETFKRVIDGTQKKFRAHLLVHHEVVDDMMKLDEKTKNESPFIELGAVKIFSDGSLGSQSALLSFPYHNDPSTNGVAIHSLDDLKGIVKKAREYGQTVAVHAIGDLAYEYVVDSIEEHPPKDGQRDRIIHAQILRKELIERTKALPVVLDIQPRFVVSDFPWVVERIGEENLPYCYAWKTLIEEGILCAGGSDAPIEPVNPLLGIEAAVTRRALSDGNMYSPQETLSVFEAVQLFTLGSAQAIYQEDKKGYIREGYVADFTVLEEDLFEINEKEISKVAVALTVVDGTVMYRKEN
ncbi:amidohydrolase [Bacillus sp. CGMCC 1.16541]|uniref:amidohydrolase n=1 Tax=Bacillus sp. CGMCC 1.16541 TaxID=2185143 RepID=UPI000D72F5D0|nr:amidohydrolase [Bacillus sp. CGMCC 1.16541]